jgi:hypothetical protein
MSVNNHSKDQPKDWPQDTSGGAELFPALKPGVNLIRTPNHIYVGLVNRGLEISSNEPEVLALMISLLDGRRSINQISTVLAHQTRLSIEPEDQSALPEFAQLCGELIAALTGANLIELTPGSTTTSKTPKTKSGLLGQNEINFAERVKPEINLAAWYEVSAIDEPLDKTLDKTSKNKNSDSMSIVKDRSNFKIDIYGKNRMAITLFTLLQATGFSQSKLIDAATNGRQVTLDLICGLNLRNSDLGSLCADIFDELRRSAQLNFHADTNASNLKEVNEPTRDPDLALSTQSISPQLLQRWMSEGTVHLGLGQLIQSSIQIGPIVKPGITPCLRCLELWRSSSNPRYQNLEILNSIARPLEISASAVSLIAGIIVLQISEFAVSQKSPLIGASANIDLLKPLTPEFEYWKPNPECGCITIN